MAGGKGRWAFALSLTATLTGAGVDAPGVHDGVTVPDDTRAVARRYLRTERLISGGVAVGIGLLGAAAFLTLPLLWALAVCLGLLALARVPVFRSDGRARMRTDADPDSVRDDFASPTPPPLALQWGIADEVGRDGDDAVYVFSYLFGLRSVEMRVRTRRDDDGVEITAIVDGQPWGTYTATIEPADGGTEIAVDVRSGRKFGLRRLPQQFVARRFRDAVLRAQGYEVIERSASFSR